MPMKDWMTPSQITGIFSSEIQSAGGTVTDSFADQSRTFARSVLPPSTDVGPGDKLKGGVALRANDTDIFVHPYVFRIVCTNGAIMARSTQTRRIRRGDFLGELETTLREAIICSCDPAAFSMAADQMRSSQQSAADTAIIFSTFMSRHRTPAMNRMLVDILARFDADADRSLYGLMNAVTSVARDTRDQEMKWRLEELGGTIPAMARKPSSPRGGRRLSVERSLVEVG